MTLKVISADDVLFTGEVSSVKLPGELGEFTVLDRHATLVSALTPGRVRYRLASSPEGTPEEAIEIGGGIADVDGGVVSVCIFQPADATTDSPSL